MSILHHPDEATLMSYAAGSLPEALGAVVSAHLAVCSDCRRELRMMDDVGGSLFGALETVAMSPSRAAEACAAMNRQPAAPDDPSHDDIDMRSDVPAPLQQFIGPNLADIPWRRLGLGIWHYPLPLSKGAKGDLRLLKVAPNRTMPDHGHGGSELTLVLSGAYTDNTGRYGRGDIADLDDTVEHQPIADAEQGCICLIASEKPARFKGVFGRLVQPLTGI